MKREEFDKLLKKQKDHNTQKWTDLEIDKIYKITDYKYVNTSFGKSVILSVKNNGEVWCPSHLAEKIENKDTPFYVRPLGLKPCKNNKKNKYHAYDLVFSEEEKN